jgi:SAM-dependent methyltransferase
MNRYFYEVFENIPRQGPGNNESTRKAFSYIRKHLPSRPDILDIGCGKGVQTIELVKLSNGRVTAVDNHQFFLDCLENFARSKGLQDKIACQNADMKALPFQDRAFDLIWAEGSVFIIGIEEGLRQWKKYLKANGFLALTDLIWLTDERPDEVADYWKQEGLHFLTASAVDDLARREGYQQIAHFTLPEEAWLEEYLFHLENAIAALRTKYVGIKEALDTLYRIEFENEMVKKHLEYLGYEFFIWRAG